MKLAILSESPADEAALMIAMAVPRCRTNQELIEAPTAWKKPELLPTLMTST